MELAERLADGRGEATQRTLDAFAELKDRVHLAVISDLGPRLYNADVDDAALRELVLSDIRSRLAQEQGMALAERDRLTREIADDTLGHGPIEPLLADDGVSEVMVNGPRDVWIERDGRLHQTAISFSDEHHVRRIINKIVGQVGRRIDESSPMVDARLPDGSRVNAVLPPLSLTGPLLTIRKFTKRNLDLEDLLRLGTLTRESVEFVEAALRAELNVLISGGTGSGKTTLLNAMSTAISDDERIITIEDAAELRLHQRHVLRLESRPKNVEGQGEIPIRELVRNSLRMRPDRIIVGEVRGAEALDMLQAMNTGHDGSLSTIHANSPRDALARVESMVLMAGLEFPMRAVRQQLSSALDLIVHIERFGDGARRVTSITEVQRMESDVITLQDLFTYKIDPDRGESAGVLQPTGLHPTTGKFDRRAVRLPSFMSAARFTEVRSEGATRGILTSPGFTR
jgi:pilus assembly protein CpaF